MTWQTSDGFNEVKSGIEFAGEHIAVCDDACGKSIQQSRGNRLPGGRIGLNLQRCRLHGEIVHELLTVGHFYYTSFPCHCSTGREKNKEGEFRMSERENDTKKMLETLRKLPEKTQEKIGYMIEGAALVSAASENEPKKDGGAA